MYIFFNIRVNVDAISLCKFGNLWNECSSQVYMAETERIKIFQLPFQWIADIQYPINWV